jgi:hypothetical protein
MTDSTSSLFCRDPIKTIQQGWLQGYLTAKNSEIIKNLFDDTYYNTDPLLKEYEDIREATGVKKIKDITDTDIEVGGTKTSVDRLKKKFAKYDSAIEQIEKSKSTLETLPDDSKAQTVKNANDRYNQAVKEYESLFSRGVTPKTLTVDKLEYVDAETLKRIPNLESFGFTILKEPDSTTGSVANRTLIYKHEVEKCHQSHTKTPVDPKYVAGLLKGLSKAGDVSFDKNELDYLVSVFQGSSLDDQTNQMKLLADLTNYKDMLDPKIIKQILTNALSNKEIKSGELLTSAQDFIRRNDITSKDQIRDIISQGYVYMNAYGKPPKVNDFYNIYSVPLVRKIQAELLLTELQTKNPERIDVTEIINQSMIKASIDKINPELAKHLDSYLKSIVDKFNNGYITADTAEELILTLYGVQAKKETINHIISFLLAVFSLIILIIVMTVLIDIVKITNDIKKEASEEYYDDKNNDFSKFSGKEGKYVYRAMRCAKAALSFFIIIMIMIVFYIVTSAYYYYKGEGRLSKRTLSGYFGFIGVFLVLCSIFLFVSGGSLGELINMQKDDEDTLVDYIGLNAKSAKSQCILFGFVFLALVVFNAIVFIKLWPKNLNEIPAGRVADDDLYISNMPCPSGKFEDEEKAIRRYETLEAEAKKAEGREGWWSPSFGTSSSKYLRGQAQDVLANELGILEPPTGDTAIKKTENIRDKRAEDLARSFGLTDAQITAAKTAQNLREIVSYGKRGVDVHNINPANKTETDKLLKARLAAKEAGIPYQFEYDQLML